MTASFALKQHTKMRFETKFLSSEMGIVIE